MYSAAEPFHGTGTQFTVIYYVMLSTTRCEFRSVTAFVPPRLSSELSVHVAIRLLN